MPKSAFAALCNKDGEPGCFPPGYSNRRLPLATSMDIPYSRNSLYKQFPLLFGHALLNLYALTFKLTSTMMATVYPRYTKGLVAHLY